MRSSKRQLKGKEPAKGYGWMNRRNNLFLIGFMGAGKSTVARYLHRHGMEWVEMDQEIERREGMAISEIFRLHGEGYFRELETGLLLSLEHQENTVVSCGGGAPLRALNVEAMKKSGIVVFLTARPETILDRVKNSQERPLLEGHKNVKDIAELLALRTAKYESAADVLVATDGRSAEEIGEEILGFLGNFTKIGEKKTENF